MSNKSVGLEHLQEKMNLSEPDMFITNDKPTMSREEARKKLGFDEDENSQDSE